MVVEKNQEIVSLQHELCLIVDYDPKTKTRSLHEC